LTPRTDRQTVVEVIATAALEVDISIEGNILRVVNGR
jgi:hypothetical protein